MVCFSFSLLSKDKQYIHICPVHIIANLFPLLSLFASNFLLHCICISLSFSVSPSVPHLYLVCLYLSLSGLVKRYPQLHPTKYG